MQHWTQDSEQVELFLQRSAAAGVSRRNFMKIWRRQPAQQP